MRFPSLSTFYPFILTRSAALIIVRGWPINIFLTRKRARDLSFLGSLAMGSGLVFVTVGTTRFQELTNSVVQAEVLQVRRIGREREKSENERSSCFLPAFSAFFSLAVSLGSSIYIA